MSIYDNFIYRLSTESPQTVFSIDLPKDLLWNDELTWGKVAQGVEYSVTGSLLIQEGVKQKGRYITLAGQPNMAWITREQCVILQQMRDTPGLIMTLKFVDSTNSSNVLFTYPTMFRHFETALELTNVKGWDQYDKSMVIMHTGTVSSGPFTAGDIITGATSHTVGTVAAANSDYIQISTSGTFTVGETITASGSKSALVSTVSLPIPGAWYSVGTIRLMEVTAYT